MDGRMRQYSFRGLTVHIWFSSSVIHCAMEPIECLLLSPSLCLSKLLFAISGFIFANKCQTPQTGGLDLADPPEVSFHRGHWGSYTDIDTESWANMANKENIQKTNQPFPLTPAKHEIFYILYTWFTHDSLFYHWKSLQFW